MITGMMRFSLYVAGAAWSFGLAQSAWATEPLPEGVVQKQVDARITHYEFPSAALHKKMAFNVVFPENYSPAGTPWPVLFFLHGLGRNENTLIEDPESRQKLLAQPYVIVLPKGDNGWYFDSPFDPAFQYASYLNEVLALAGRVVNISAERSQRAIGGWSAGGFGSTWASLRHPDSFCTLATIIAVVDFPAPGVRFPIQPKIFGTDPARWPEFNPLNRAAELKNFHILLVIGEKASDAVMNEHMSEALTAAGIPNETVKLPGGHTFPTVQGGVGPVLDFVRKHLAPRP
jgi:S-formylglutathione hydrolase FrmB